MSAPKKTSTPSARTGKKPKPRRAAKAAANTSKLSMKGENGSEVRTGNARIEAFRADLRSEVHVRGKLAIAIEALLDELITRLPTMTNEQVLLALKILLDGYHLIKTSGGVEADANSKLKSQMKLALGLRHLDGN